MRDAAREGAERFHFPALTHLSFVLLAVLLGAFQVGHIGDRADVSRDRAVGVQLHPRLANQPGDLAIGAHKTKFRRRGAALPHDLGPAVDHPRAVLGVQCRFPAVAARLLECEAGDLAPPAVHEDRASLRVGAEDADRRDVRQYAETFLTPPERGLSLALLRHVAKAPHAADRLAAQQLRPGEALDHAPILGVQNIEHFVL